MLLQAFQPFKLNIQFRLIKDLSLSGLEIIGLISTFIIAIPLIAREIENKTIYTLLAKPITRNLYLTGRLLGAGIAITVVWGVLALESMLVLWFKTSSWDFPFLSALFLILLEFYIILLWVILFSSLVSPPLNLSITTMIFVVGNFSYFLKEFLYIKVHPIIAFILKGLFYIIPNFTYLHTHDAVVHNIPVSNGYYIKVILYALVYMACIYQIGLIAFERKDLA